VTAQPRVVLGDADVLSRVGVRRTLEQSGFDVLAGCGDAAGTISACSEHRPQLCLIDVDLIGPEGVTVQEIGSLVPAPRIVVLSLSRHGEDLMTALEAGATGYLLKDMNADRLAHTLRRVLEGETAVPRGMVSALADAVRSRRVRAIAGVAAPGLSPREQQVLALLADGLRTAEIGDRLRISAVTVRRHVSSLVAKLGVADREAAARLVAERRRSSADGRERP
jgi:DNA-binding NarL/FixJ family response regulator